ncbi:MAG TPA: MBL fold metallo-hydrolase [Thermoleophilaceae bacterium]|nr:MBL fold metallo-hydrolase [Thermoleophilaceae bacterium]
MLIDSVAWLGHAGFRVDAGSATVYIDPYRVAPGEPPADVILITHGHYDHYSPRDVEALSHDGTWLIAPAAVAERARGRVASIAPGETIELEHLRGIDVTAVAAYNTSKRDSDGNAFHPRQAGGVGFDVNVRGERLYHAGDTDVIPEMDAVTGVDVALLPVCGTYVMTADEAVEAARRIQPRVAVPSHWGSHLGSRADAEAFAQRAPVDVRVFEPPA